MDREQVKDSWNELAGKICQKWAKLTDNDIALLKGRSREC